MTTRTKSPSEIQLDATALGNVDWDSVTSQMFQRWKEQLDTSLRMIDAMVQGAMAMRTSQLTAATETHTRDLGAEKSVLDARTPSDLLMVQLNWMTSNLERSMAYWTQMFQAASDANAKLFECLHEHEQASGGAPGKATNASG